MEAAAGQLAPMTTAAQATRHAIITPSYAGDHARCALLCASIDRFVSGHDMHYILIEDRDAPLFRHLEGPNRKLICDSQILPAWLRPHRDPFHKGRRMWSSLRTWPMRGWHVQQLRKLAIAAHIDEDVMLHCDSDVVFVRPFALTTLEDQAGRTRLYRVLDGITAQMTTLGHVQWCRNAAKLLGLATPALPTADYINNLISWRKDHVLALHRHIEAHSGTDWITALGRQRTFSEAVVYGMFVDKVLGQSARHFPDAFELCKTIWFGESTNSAEIRGFVNDLQPGQCAIGLQSFIDAPIEDLRQLLDGSP
jgi:hypothetical protein